MLRPRKSLTLVHCMTLRTALPAHEKKCSSHFGPQERERCPILIPAADKATRDPGSTHYLRMVNNVFPPTSLLKFANCGTLS